MVFGLFIGIMILTIMAADHPLIESLKFGRIVIFLFGSVVCWGTMVLYFQYKKLLMKEKGD